MAASRLISLAALLLLLGGCGGDDGGEGAPEPKATTGGLTAYEVSSAGFEISVPEGWKAISVDDVEESGAFEEFAEDNPEFKPFASALSGPDSVMKFVAIDPAVQEDFATNLNVIVEPLPAGMPHDEYVDATLGQLDTVGVAEGDVEREAVTLPAGEAERLSYESSYAFADVDRAIATVQYLIVEEDKGYVLTYTTLPEFEEKKAEEFAASAESFRLL